MPDKSKFHENLSDREDVKVGSERSFGLVFSAVFAIVALWPLVFKDDQEGGLRIWAFATSALFAITALTIPRILAPLNKLWFKFGLLLHRVVNPLVMAILFFSTIMPIGLLMRAFGKIPLQLDFDKKADSYWHPRTPPGPAPKSMKRQF